MATQSFKGLQNEAPESTELTAPVKHEVAVPKQVEMPTGVEGEVNVKDLSLPRLNLVQKMSDLTSVFKSGDLVYNKELLLPQPVQTVVVRIRKQYQQDLPYGTGETPHVCDTIEEVKASGGTTEWGEENHYSEIAHLQLLIRKPDDLALTAGGEELFSYEFDGVRWAPAVFTVAKSAYKTAAKPVFTAAFNALRGGLGQGLWQLTSEQKANAMGSWHVPVMKLAGKSPESVASFAAHYAA